MNPLRPRKVGKLDSETTESRLKILLHLTLRFDPTPKASKKVVVVGDEKEDV
jgi:hypothetical protein